MIMGSFDRMVTETAHDHGCEPMKPTARCIRHRYDRSE